MEDDSEAGPECPKVEGVQKQSSVVFTSTFPLFSGFTINVSTVLANERSELILF